MRITTNITLNMTDWKAPLEILFGKLIWWKAQINIQQQQFTLLADYFVLYSHIEVLKSEINYLNGWVGWVKQEENLEFNTIFQFYNIKNRIQLEWFSQETLRRKTPFKPNITMKTELVWNLLNDIYIYFQNKHLLHNFNALILLF